jgi:acetate kinase
MPVQAARAEDCLALVETVVRDRAGANLAAIAHRVVHGGQRFPGHCRIDEQVIAELGKISDLAPNHLPSEIAFMAASLRHFNEVPQIACFDTVFHRDMPRVAQILPLPRRLETDGVRRYGFHGLSYTYLMQRLPDFIGEKARGRVILAHLGSGASMAAVKNGKSIDTTMGLTPLGGLVMATRSGDLDPGVAGYLERSQGVSGQDFEHMAYAESGLKGISETSGDVRDLLEHEAGDVRAAEALAVFCYQARKWIGALTAALEGVDVLVFTGGIGEHSAILRQRICDQLDWLGVTLDPAANRGADQCISAPSSKVMVFALPTDEEREMADIAIELIR